MSSAICLGLLLCFYKRTLPATIQKPFTQDDKKFMLTLGYYDGVLVKKIHKLAERDRPMSRDGGQMEGILDEADRHEGFTAHQQVVLLAEHPLEDSGTVLPGDGLFAISFFDMGECGNGLHEWNTCQIEDTLKTMSARIGGWPLDIRVYYTMGSNAVAAVIQTDVQALETYMPSDSLRTYKTFPSKALALLRALRRGDAEMCDGLMGKIIDSYTIFGFGFNGSISEKELDQPLSWQLQVRTKSNVYPQAFRARLLHAIKEVSNGTDYKKNIEMNQYHSGLYDYSIRFHDIPLRVMKKLYCVNGFFNGSNESGTSSDCHIFMYVSDFCTEIVDASDWDDKRDEPPFQQQYQPRWKHDDFQSAKKGLEAIRAPYASLYSSMQETVSNYEQNITLHCDRWVDELYTPILRNLMMQVRCESLFRASWGRNAPDPSRFIDQFERTLQHVLHSNAYNTNTKGYHLSQYTFMPRLVTGYTSLVNRIAVELEMNDRLEVYGNRFLLSAHAAHCTGISSTTAIRDSNGPFGICVNIWTPRSMLFKPVDMIELLMHEAGHFIAPRLRDVRTKCLLDFSLNTALCWLLGRWSGGGFIPLTLDRLLRNDPVDRPAKYLLAAVSHYRGEMLDFFTDMYRDKMKQVQLASFEEMKKVEAASGAVDGSLSHAVYEASDASKAFGSFVHQVMNDALDMILYDPIKWTNYIYGYLRSGIMTYSDDIDRDTQKLEGIIKTLLENWKGHLYSQKSHKDERRLASHCLTILADIISDIFMIHVLNMDVGRYLKLHQDYNISAKRLSDQEYMIRMETPAINVRIMTVLNVCYNLDKSGTWPKELDDVIYPELLKHIKKAYDEYLWIQKNAMQNDDGAPDKLEILYSYGTVRAYAQAVHQQVQTGGFLRSDAVRDLQCLYKKALRIEKGNSKEEHAFFLHLLKMNPDITGA